MVALTPFNPNPHSPPPSSSILLSQSSYFATPPPSFSPLPSQPPGPSSSGPLLLLHSTPNHPSTRQPPPPPPPSNQFQPKHQTKKPHNRTPNLIHLLKFVPQEEPGVAVIPNDILDSVDDEWNCTLIGCFTGRYPGFQAVKEIISKWEVEVQVFSHESGWIIFKLTNEEDAQKVIQNGPYEGNLKYLMLRRMPEDFQFDETGLLIVHVWVQLPSLPLKYWAADRLSIIASAIGEPVMMDCYTTNRERVSYARVLIHVNAANKLPEKVWVKKRNGGFC